jgi:hypothetical protein
VVEAVLAPLVALHQVQQVLVMVVLVHLLIQPGVL